MCKKIVTFSFDDCEIYDRRLCDLFRKYNMKATFFLISDQLSFKCDFNRYGEQTVVERVSPGEIKTTYKGMEVASHTANHSFAADDVENTVLKSAEYLSSLCGYKVKGMAYPGGAYMQEHINALKGTDIIYARTASPTHSFTLPQELLAWNPTCKYDDPEIFNLAEKFLNYNGEQPALFNVYGHSYELTRKEHGCDWESFERLLKNLSGRDDVWYGTNIEIAEWLKNVRSNY